MEAEFITWLRRQSQVGVIDDDAATICVAPRTFYVVTTDMLNDGVDFRLGHDEPRRIGRKALAVNLSDLAAMAARPLHAFVSLSLPRQDSLELAKELFKGILPLAKKYETGILGGDTNVWDGPLAICITAIGKKGAGGLLMRGGAFPGNLIVVSGQFGGSILGHHFDFEPRVQEAMTLQQHYELIAGMDVSDGLSLDLAKMCAASNCGAVLELDQIPISPAAHQLAAERKDGVSALDHALGDGEDFELLLAVPEDQWQRMQQEKPVDVPLTCIGRFIEEPGLWTESADGKLQSLTPRGWEHRGNE